MHAEKRKEALHEPHEVRGRARIESGGGPPHSKTLARWPQSLEPPPGFGVRRPCGALDFPGTHHFKPSALPMLLTDLSIDEYKFAAVKKEATRVRQAMLPNIVVQEIGFARTRRSGEGHPVSPVNLFRRIGAIPLQPRGEKFALAEDKRIVERGQCLQRGESDVAFWREQAGVGTIERFHEWVRYAPHDEAVNAASNLLPTDDTALYSPFSC